MNTDQDKEAIEAVLMADRAAITAAQASAVSIKLPTFWPQKVSLWFAQAEAQFQIKGISVDKTKYLYFVSMLDDSAALQIMDIIEELPEENAYNTLKTPLIAAYAITDDEKAARILDTSGLGDKVQSQLLNEMLQLVPRG